MSIIKRTSKLQKTKKDLSTKIRYFTHKNVLYIVAKDIGKLLNYARPDNMYKLVPENMRAYFLLDTISSPQMMLCLTIQALNIIKEHSHKPSASVLIIKAINSIIRKNKSKS